MTWWAPTVEYLFSPRTNQAASSVQYGLGIHINNIVGMVPTHTYNGYFVVGSDGGVFAFNAPFANSLPGRLGVRLNDIVGIVATANDQGYWLVGRDGGVFAFNAPSSTRSRGLESELTRSSG